MMTMMGRMWGWKHHPRSGRRHLQLPVPLPPPPPQRRLQLGPIPWNTYPFLGTSAKAFSLLRKLAPILPPNTDQAPRLSCWHSVLFRDTNNNTYFSPKLIRARITRIGQCTPDLQERLLPTWAPRYKAQLGQAWPRPQMTPPQETSAIFWGGWNTKAMLRYLMRQEP